uniref:3-hydroxyisobutyrate dehydrogenase n=1 Tax=Physcomitrium patens TaxID=3218 RepID=A0A7I4FLV3_PHYPA
MAMSTISVVMRLSRKTNSLGMVCALRSMGLRFSSLADASNGSGEPQDVGFIGLGNMGSHMATNLLKAGHRLTVYDRNEAVMQTFAERGATVAHNPREVADASDVVITMLPSSPHVEEVYTGKNGILSNVGSVRPSLLIDSSTIDPHKSRLLATKVAKCKLLPNSKKVVVGEVPVLLDAPVSGGVVGAQAATLTFMIGGHQEGFQVAEPLLRAMGSRIVYCGGPGNGAAAKVCNNLALAISMAGVAEALALGQQLGIDAHTLSNIFNSSSARCWSSDTYNPVPGVMANVPASRDYKGGFSSQLLLLRKLEQQSL